MKEKKPIKIVGNYNTSTSAPLSEENNPKLQRRNRTVAIIMCVALALFIALVIVCIAYVSSYHHADADAIEAFLSVAVSDDLIANYVEDGNVAIKLKDSTPNTAIIFYPGGKVEHTAYVPLMKKCAESGILCIIAKMPFNLAFFNTGAANDIKEDHPEITNWYICGHSLGGSAASVYLKKHADEFEGLILLGSYASHDLSETDLRVLTVRGSNDEIVTKKDHEKHLENLPKNYQEAIIEGGCHAYFGMYGEQKGDGTPAISPTDQITQAAYLITSFINSNKS